jgi:hypothetical protein
MKELYTALLAAKKNIRPPSKNSKAMYGRYADLESVLTSVQEPLANEGLVLTQWGTFNEANQPTLRTVLVHAPTGQSIQSDFPLVAKDPNDPQKLGGSITYARRYGITAILSIVADDDDDGNTSAGRQPNGQPLNATKPAPATTTATTTQLNERLTTALNNEFIKAGYSTPQEQLRVATEVTKRNVTNIRSISEGEARAIVQHIRNNPTT